MSWLGRLFGKSEKPPGEMTEREKIEAVDEQRAAARKRVWSVVHEGRGLEIVRAQSTTPVAATRLVERVGKFIGCELASLLCGDDGTDWAVVVAKGEASETSGVPQPQPGWRWVDRHDFDERLVGAFNALFGPTERRLYLADVAEHEDDARGALLYISLDEARRLAADGAFLHPKPPTPEELAALAEEDAAYEEERAREAAAEEEEEEDDDDEPELDALLRLGDLVDGVAVLGDTLVAVGGEVLVTLAELGQGTQRTLTIKATAIARHGDRIYVGDAAGTVHVLDAGLREVASRRVAEQPIFAIAASDDAVLVSHAESDDLVVLDAQLAEVRRLGGSNAPPFGLCVLPGARYGGGGQTPVRYRVWDANGRELASIAIPKATTTMGAALSPDGTRLAVVADQRSVLVDAVTFDEIGDLPSGWACAWTPAGTLVVGHLGELRELDRAGDELARVDPFDGDGHNVSAIAVLDDGRVVAGFERGQVWIGALER
jgi:hypothetical protein